MEAEVEVLDKIVEDERKLGIYDEKILGVPLWRIYRFRIVTQYIKRNYGISSYTAEKRIKFVTVLKNTIISLWQFLRLFLSKQTFENVVFAFPRLQKIGTLYIDKFTDPVIQNSNIKNNCLIFQRPLAGAHNEPRCHHEIAVKSDIVEILSLLFTFIFLPCVVIIYGSKVIRIFKKAKIIFSLNRKNFFYFFLILSHFLVRYSTYHWIIKRIRPKRIFLVNREIVSPLIVACKKMNVYVYEMQHGITLGTTILYSGDYDPNIDPDYFLVFGEAWRGPQFGIPTEQIINIGWAYKDMVRNLGDDNFFSSKTILVISEPEISKGIVEAISLLARTYDEYTFHIRLHPQEKMEYELLQQIEQLKNVSIQDNLKESSLALLAYEVVIGVNSSVLYEALSLGKRVGRLNFCELEPQISVKFPSDTFKYIKNVSDFKLFMDNSDGEKFENEEFLYSAFKREVVNHLS